MTAGYNSGGVATTTTAGFALVATNTLSSFATTGNGGNIATTTTNAHGTTTPVDVVITNGTDCLTDGGNTVLDFYFEKYFPEDGAFTLWVEPDDISSTSAKTILMYYGYADATDQSDEAGVFGSLGEIGVWNFSEDPSSAGSGGILDSTSNNNDGTDNGSMNTADQVPGMVNGSFDFDGSNDYISADSNISGGNDTAGAYSFWVYDTNTSNNDWISSDSQNPIIYSGSGSVTFVQGPFTTSNACQPSTSISQSVWTHFILIYDSSGCTVYKNGVYADFDAKNHAYATTTTFYMGSDRLISGRYFQGGLDDVRMYNRAFSVADVQTIYNNTVDSSTFWTFGSEVENPSLPDAPAGLITTSNTGSVDLSWMAPSSPGDSDLETYGVWRGITPFTATSGATLIATQATTSTTYSDTSVVHGTIYYYGVTATNQTATGSLSNIQTSNSNSGRKIRLGGLLQ